MISASDIRFDIDKEPRVSVEDSHELICIDVDRVGDGYRAIINGREYELPPGIGSINDARKIAVEIAVREVNAAIGELIEILNA